MSSRNYFIGALISLFFAVLVSGWRVLSERPRDKGSVPPPPVHVAPSPPTHVTRHTELREQTPSSPTTPGSASPTVAASPTDAVSPVPTTSTASPSTALRGHTAR